MSIAERVSRFDDGYLDQLPGGAGRTAPRVPIDTQKATAGAVVFCPMLRADGFRLAAWLCLVLHGSYGILGLVKDVAFPDPPWRRPQSLSSAVAVFVFPLGAYDLAPLVMLTGLGRAVPGGRGTTSTLPAGVAAAVVAGHAFGVLLHFGAGGQKDFVLAHQRPRRLITDGFFAATRNPNDLGEIPIYSSFCLLAQHGLPSAACATVWLQVFPPSMLRKDRSLSRDPERPA